MHVDITYKYETIYDEEFAAATLASNNKETTADTIANYDDEFAIATFAANDEETAAAEGKPWGT